MNTKSGKGIANPVDILPVEDDPGDIRLTKEAFKDGQIANTLPIVADGVDALDFLFNETTTPTHLGPASCVRSQPFPESMGTRCSKNVTKILTVGAFQLSSSRVGKLKLTSSSPTNNV